MNVPAAERTEMIQQKPQFLIFSCKVNLQYDFTLFSRLKIHSAMHIETR